MIGRWAIVVLWLACIPLARAEPYIAVNQGLKCISCHTSATGGGKRNAYGNVFAQTQLPARTLRAEGKTGFWTGEVFKYLAVGGDLRGGWNRIDVPEEPQTSQTELNSFLGYIEIKAIPNYLTLYIDAKLAPGDVEIREQYVRLSISNGKFYIKGGEFFLPYGLRLQDDSAFIRQVPGINFNTPDTGFEFGWEQGQWSAQFAVTRGAAENLPADNGRQYSLLINHVRSRWRVGGSLNFNDTDIGDRQMQNLFAGVKTGRVAWLAEIDYIIDDGSPTGRRKSWATLLEANTALKKGHNLKLGYEHFDPDTEVPEDQQNRYSIVWEYSPIQFLQTRAGYRRYSGIPQNAAQNREQYFLELHIAF